METFFYQKKKFFRLKLIKINKLNVREHIEKNRALIGLDNKTKKY